MIVSLDLLALRARRAHRDGRIEDALRALCDLRAATAAVEGPIRAAAGLPIVEMESDEA